jgi:hypothetical protein
MSVGSIRVMCSSVTTNEHATTYKFTPWGKYSTLTYLESELQICIWKADAKKYIPRNVPTFEVGEFYELSMTGPLSDIRGKEDAEQAEALRKQNEKKTAEYLQGVAASLEADAVPSAS